LGRRRGPPGIWSTGPEQLVIGRRAQLQTSPPAPVASHERSLLRYCGAPCLPHAKESALRG